MIDLVVQNAASGPDIPLEKDFQLWVKATLADHAGNAAVTLRLVDEQEARELNQRFRKKDYATNVLSFPADLQAMIELPDLGDIVAHIVGVVSQRSGKRRSEHKRYDV